jgi:hypothetical protein
MLHFLIVIKFTIELKLFNLFSFYRCSKNLQCLSNNRATTNNILYQNENIIH